NEKDYTEDSFALLQKAVKEAEAVVENPESVEEVKAAYVSLQEALKNLEKVSTPSTSNKSYLKELLDAAKQLDAKAYTKESYAKVKQAIAAAETVLADPQSDEAVEEAIA